MAISSSDREAVLKVIETWPAEDQMILAQMIWERVVSRRASQAHPYEEPVDTPSTWDVLYGIASNGQTPPTDEEVAQWLDEHRMEKYGK